MADPDSGAPAPGQGEAGGAAEPKPQLAVRSQYVRDLSFENPAAPASLDQNEASPDIKVNVQVEARAVGKELYESSLRITADARRNETPVFLVDITYCGLFFISGVPQGALEPLLMVECPRQLFPFARRVMADTVRDGGFPPLMLNPIDFLTLYRSRPAPAGGDGAEAAGGNSDGGGEPAGSA